MLDMDFIVQNPDAVRHAIEVKNVGLDLEEVLRMHDDVKALLAEIEELRHDRNVLSKQAGKADPSEREKLIEHSRGVGAKLKEMGIHPHATAPTVGYMRRTVRRARWPVSPLRSALSLGICRPRFLVALRCRCSC